jgi:hypothetical protein
MAVIQVERIQERRKALRVEDTTRAYLTEKGSLSPVPGMDEFLAPLFGKMLNLSETGLLLELEEAVQPGRAVVIGVELDGRRIELDGVVARVCRPRSSPVHVGIRFRNLSEDARRAIGQAVEAGRFAPYLN